MSNPDYVIVRRFSDTPFGVLPGDLVSEDPRGYDLDLVRSMTLEGLTTPLTVEPLPDGRFKVVDGLKRLAAIRVLVQINKVVYDALRKLRRPASRAFGLIHCRLQSPPGAAEKRHGP